MHVIACITRILCIHAVCRSQQYLNPPPPRVNPPMSEKFSNPPRPSRPPPPQLPDGWVAIWDDEYQRYYYANKVTKTTQWELPTTPATPKLPARSPPASPPVYAQTSPNVQYQTVPVQVQTVPVQTIPVQTVPVQTVPTQRYGQQRSSGPGLMTGLVVGSLIGRRRRRR